MKLQAVWGLALVVAACAPPSSAGLATPTAQVQALETQVAALREEFAAVSALSAPTPTPATEGVALAVAAEPTPAPEEAEASASPTARVFPTRTPRPLTASDAAPCAVGQIKGNRNSRIYHVPGGGSYSQTRANVQCFDTEAEAQAAGYRRARN